MGLLDDKENIQKGLLANQTIRNIPRNLLGGAIADVLKSVKSNTGIVGDFMLGRAPEVIDDMSYGFYPTRGSGMTTGLKPEAADLLNVIPSATIAGILGKGYGKLAGKEIARQVQTGTGLLGKSMLDPRINMVAYHGSPHSFDKFDMSKIGTGEGAQAYGHGLYFAESHDVAKSYADELGSKFSVNGKNIYNSNNTVGSVENSDLQDALIASLGNAKQASKSLLTSASEMRKANVSPKDYQAALAELRKIRGGIKLENTGNMYKVDIPDSAIPKMLDWDKPLSAQPWFKDSPSYDELIATVKREGRKPTGREILLAKVKSPYTNLSESMTGEQLYSNIGKNAVESANNAKQYGIPGIRYLDGGSRGAGQGSSNFVVFDDKLPTILERNGKAR